MVDEPDTAEPEYIHVKKIDGRDIVVAPRRAFAKAIHDGCLPFEADEIRLMNTEKVKLQESSVILLAKTYFPKSTLVRVQCRKTI